MQKGADTHRVENQILAGTDRGGKTYTFDEEHDENLPTRWWFQESEEGIILFVVFYTQACRWSRCVSCSLPSTCSKFPVSWQAQKNQVDYLFALPEVQAKKTHIRKIIVSNNGSVLDQDTFSSTVLMHLVAMINIHFVNLKVFTLETRPEYVELAELEFLARGLREGATPSVLELGVGLETFDDHVRNNVLKKGLELRKLEKLVAEMVDYHFRLKCYLMLKPVPGMTSEAAIADIHEAIDYLTQLSARHVDEKNEPRVRINIHLNPTYVACGTLLEEAFLRGEYKPPTLRDVARAVLPSEQSLLTVYIGLSDEGLAVLGGSFLRSGEEQLVTWLEAFNATQDYDFIRKVLAATEA